MLILKLFTAHIAEYRFRQVVASAFAAESRFFLFSGGMTATGAEIGIRSKILSAASAPDKDKLLMPAGGAEFCVGSNRIAAFRAIHSFF